MSRRAISSVVGLVCLLAVTVVLAATVGAVAPATSTSSPTIATFEASAEPTGEIRVAHRGGDAIDPETIELHISVDGEPLAEQPPVPFFSARGFESGPTGAFNSASRTRCGTARSDRLGGIVPVDRRLVRHAGDGGDGSRRSGRALLDAVFERFESRGLEHTIGFSLVVK